MNTQEKRRGGAPTGHVLRAGSHSHSSHSHHHTRAHNAPSGPSGGATNTSSSSSNIAKDKDKPASATLGGGLPTLPPRAAVLSSEDPHDGTTTGGVPLDKEGKEPSAGSDRSGASNAGGGISLGINSTSNKSPRRTASVTSAKSNKKHRDSVTATMPSSSSSTSPSATAQQLLLRERDERIAALEKEMDIMEREFTRELDKLSQNESETATFWQAKHSALNQQFLRADTELRLLRSEVELREGEREELRQGWEVLRREAREKDEEIRGLRGQVRGLKEWVSTSTRTDGQTSDEVFGDGMARLGNGLQNWVIVNFRKSKIDLGKADEATLGELSELIPMFEELAQTSKVHLLQSLVSSILVEMVFNAYYAGLSEAQTSQFRQMEQLLLSFTGSDEPVNQWRSSTLALIRREAPQRLSSSTSTLADAVIKRINRILDAITTIPTTAPAASSAASTSPTSDSPRDSGLRVLITSAIDLARQLAVQKAVLRVYFPHILPHQRVPFEADMMEDMGGEDEDSLATREICCVTFPGVIKHGDESGGHLQYRNVIKKARVLCSPED